MNYIYPHIYSNYIYKPAWKQIWSVLFTNQVVNLKYCSLCFVLWLLSLTSCDICGRGLTIACIETLPTLHGIFGGLCCATMLATLWEGGPVVERQFRNSARVFTGMPGHTCASYRNSAGLAWPYFKEMVSADTTSMFISLLELPYHWLTTLYFSKSVLYASPFCKVNDSCHWLLTPEILGQGMLELRARGI